MTSSSLFNHHGPLRSQPIFSKRTASSRGIPYNRRKHQVKLGQIVYYERRHRKIVPMMVYYIDDCSLWAKSFEVRGTTTNRKDFNIYYGLQPLIKRNGRWVKKKFVSMNIRDAMKYNNNKLWDSGFIGHGVCRPEFNLTYAEAKWARMFNK